MSELLRPPTSSTLLNAAEPDCECFSASQALSVALVNAHVLTTMGEFAVLGFARAHAAAATSEITTALDSARRI